MGVGVVILSGVVGVVIAVSVVGLLTSGVSDDAAEGCMITTKAGDVAQPVIQTVEEMAIVEMTLVADSTFVDDGVVVAVLVTVGNNVFVGVGVLIGKGVNGAGRVAEKETSWLSREMTGVDRIAARVGPPEIALFIDLFLSSFEYCGKFPCNDI